MARLINPKTRTAVHVTGALEARYRKQGWFENYQPAEGPVSQTAEGSEVEQGAADGETQEAVLEDQPTRRNTRRTK